MSLAQGGKELPSAIVFKGSLLIDIFQPVHYQTHIARVFQEIFEILILPQNRMLGNPVQVSGKYK